eukprot:scaffold10710_cov17-Tisochrysis_lutea.AAC.1
MATTVNTLGLQATTFHFGRSAFGALATAAHWHHRHYHPPPTCQVFMLWSRGCAMRPCACA